MSRERRDLRDPDYVYYSKQQHRSRQKGIKATQAEPDVDWQMDPRYTPSLASPIDEIEPWLHAGSHQARDHVSMRGIDRVMSLALPSERERFSALDTANGVGVGVLEVPFKLSDAQTHDPVIMREFLKDTFNLLTQWHRQGHTVLVHCDAGVSRSAFVLCDFFMKRDGLCFKHALARLEKKRYCLCPNPLFQRILKGVV